MRRDGGVLLKTGGEGSKSLSRGPRPGSLASGWRRAALLVGAQGLGPAAEGALGARAGSSGPGAGEPGGECAGGQAAKRAPSRRCSCRISASRGGGQLSPAPAQARPPGPHQGPAKAACRAPTGGGPQQAATPYGELSGGDLGAAASHCNGSSLAPDTQPFPTAPARQPPPFFSSDPPLFPPWDGPSAPLQPVSKS